MSRFVLIKYSGEAYFEQFDGKAIAPHQRLTIHLPNPCSSSDIHERVCGFRRFQPITSTVPNGNPWQRLDLIGWCDRQYHRIFKCESNGQNGSRGISEGLELQCLRLSDTPSS